MEAAVVFLMPMAMPHPGCTRLDLHVQFKLDTELVLYCCPMGSDRRRSVVWRHHLLKSEMEIGGTARQVRGLALGEEVVLPVCGIAASDRIQVIRLQDICLQQCVARRLIAVLQEMVLTFLGLPLL